MCFPNHKKFFIIFNGGKIFFIMVFLIFGYLRHLKTFFTNTKHLVCSPNYFIGWVCWSRITKSKVLNILVLLIGIDQWVSRKVLASICASFGCVWACPSQCTLSTFWKVKSSIYYNFHSFALPELETCFLPVSPLYFLHCLFVFWVWSWSCCMSSVY